MELLGVAGVQEPYLEQGASSGWEVDRLFVEIVSLPPGLPLASGLDMSNVNETDYG